MIKILAAQTLGAGAKARAHGGMLRPEPNEILDPKLESVDGGSLVEGRANLRERRVHRRAGRGPCRDCARANTFRLALLAPPVDHRLHPKSFAREVTEKGTFVKRRN